MGFRALGKVTDGYNTLNDEIKGKQDEVKRSDQFLSEWIKEKIPDMITNLAIRVVDDGSGTIGKATLDAGQDKSFIENLFK